LLSHDALGLPLQDCEFEPVEPEREVLLHVGIAGPSGLEEFLRDLEAFVGFCLPARRRAMARKRCSYAVRLVVAGVEPQ
jgi:hypothetical protein